MRELLEEDGAAANKLRQAAQRLHARHAAHVQNVLGGELPIETRQQEGRAWIERCDRRAVVRRAIERTDDGLIDDLEPALVRLEQRRRRAAGVGEHVLRKVERLLLFAALERAQGCLEWTVG